MNWIIADTAEKSAEINDLSEKEKVLVFIYSPKKAVDHVVKTLLEREWYDGEMKMKTYLADITNNNSMKLTEKYDVQLTSPLAMIIEKGLCVFKAVNGKILFDELRKFAN